MSLFGLFKKKSDETKVGNVEDFISLTRVYFQSVIATNLGITNIRFLPDVANFKRLFKIPTQGGKLGQVRIGRKVSFAQNVDAGLRIEREFLQRDRCFCQT